MLPSFCSFQAGLPPRARPLLRGSFLHLLTWCTCRCSDRGRALRRSHHEHLSHRSTPLSSGLRRPPRRLESLPTVPSCHRDFRQHSKCYPKLKDSARHTLLQWHSHSLLDSEISPPSASGRGLDRKPKPCIHDAMEAIAKKPKESLIGGRRTWSQGGMLSTLPGLSSAFTTERASGRLLMCLRRGGPDPRML